MASTLDDSIAAHFAHHGGLSQRLEAASSAPGTRVAPSNLRKRLLELWAWGRLPACEVQALAHAAQLDGLHHPEVESLAKIGAHGAHPGNARGDLIRSNVSNIVSPKPVIVEIPLKNKDGLVENRRQLMLSPLDVLETVWGLSQSLFKEVFAKDLRAYWDGVREDDPRWHSHSTLRDKPSWKTRALPIVIHGGGATFTSRGEHSMCTIDWRALLSPRFKGWISQCGRQQGVLYARCHECPLVSARSFTQ